MPCYAEATPSEGKLGECITTGKRQSMTDEPARRLDTPTDDPIVTGIVDRLRHELDASLHYHRPAHTEDVIQQTLALAKLDALDAHSLLLLAIAAAFHDAGFLVTRSGHESISADMATAAMAEDKRFSQKDIDIVANMIMDTQVYQIGAVHRPNTPLSPWLLDADLANFGRDDFFEQFHLIALENNIEPDRLVSTTIDLMDRHTWQSPAGSACFESKKWKNREALTQASF